MVFEKNSVNSMFLEMWAMYIRILVCMSIMSGIVNFNKLLNFGADVYVYMSGVNVPLIHWD